MYCGYSDALNANPLLTTNGSYEASTRYRVLQYEPALRAAGHSLHVHSLFRAVERRTPRQLALALIEQARALLTSASYDRVLVHRFIFPGFANWLVKACKQPIIYDFDDALWLSSSIKPLLRSAARVLAGNAYLAEYAKKYAREVEVMPTVVDTQVFRPAAKRPGLVGWIGSPTTFPYVQPLLNELPRPLRIVGAPSQLRDVEQPPWSIADEPRLFSELEVGIYPLADDVWAHGKCGLKALQYMACGVASVMSPVGVVPEIAGDAALYARTPSEFQRHVRALLADAALRETLLQRARLTFTLDRYAPRFVRAIERG